MQHRNSHLAFSGIPSKSSLFSAWMRIPFTLIKTIVSVVKAPIMSRILPSLPSRSLDVFGLSLQDSLASDLQDIFADQQKDEEDRDVVFSVQKKISIGNNQLLECVRNGDIVTFPSQLAEVKGMTQQVANQRLQNVFIVYHRYIECACYYSY